MADCLFCRIVAEEIPADVVATNDAAVAFRDISPTAPTHVLVIPRSHHANLVAVARDDPDTLIAMLRLAGDVAHSEGVTGDGDDDGYRLVANTGPAAHQTVFHAHLHLIGGRRMGWPPG